MTAAMARTAPVAGANQGIGLETCRQLKKTDHTVILTGRNEEAGSAAAEQLGLDHAMRDVTPQPAAPIAPGAAPTGG